MKGVRTVLLVTPPFRGDVACPSISGLEGLCLETHVELFGVDAQVAERTTMHLVGMRPVRVSPSDDIRTIILSAQSKAIVNCPLEITKDVLKGVSPGCCRTAHTPKWHTGCRGGCE